MITLLLFVCVAVCVGACVAAVVLARPTTPATAPDRFLAQISEAVRLRLAAALLDFGNHLMLCAEERRAFRLRKRLSSSRARRLGLHVAAVKAGARRLDDLTLEIAIGERPQEGNPRRTLALSCVVYVSPGHHASDPPEDVPALFWRVANRPSPRHGGPSVTVDVPDLERAIIAYHARPLRITGGAKGGANGARFFDEGTYGESVV